MDPITFAAKLNERYWALLPSTLTLMQDLVGAAPEEIARRLGYVYDPKAPLAYDAVTLAAYGANGGANGAPPETSGIYVLALRGVLTQWGGWCGPSTDALAKAIRSMAGDQSVRTILLDIDSPGGDVFGVEELGDAIAEAAAAKKVIAIADSLCASGAYWIAAQASELIVAPGGQVGSIGVFTMHVDFTKMLEAAGVKMTVVTAGKFKAELHPAKELSPEALQALQDRVNQYYDSFVRAVAKGREVGPAAVRSDFGQGRLVSAKDAVDVGMADRVATLAETLDKLTARGRATVGAEEATTREEKLAKLRERRDPEQREDAAEPETPAAAAAEPAAAEPDPAVTGGPTDAAAAQPDATNAPPPVASIATRRKLWKWRGQMGA